jgi:aspartate aminotransferase
MAKIIYNELFDVCAGDQMRPISSRLENTEASSTVSLGDRIAELKEKGHDIISFSLGEPDFPTPEHIVRAAKEALDSGYTKYAPSRGLPELREAIADRYNEGSNVPYGRENVLVTPAKHALFMSCLGIVNKGDEVIVLEPSWVTYRPCVQVAEGSPVAIGSKGEFKLNPDDIAEKITGKTKALIINSPCNPTGHVIKMDALKGIADLAEDHDFWVISDEIYDKIIFDGEHVSIASIGNMFERTLVINGFSKAYSMTGWRMGWLLGPENVVAEIDKIQQHSITCVSPFAQKAGIAALKGSQDCVSKMVEEFGKRRDFMVDTLNSIDGFSCHKPEGTFYAFPRFDFDMSSKTFATSLLEKAKVAATPGIAFGKSGEGHLRLSFATGIDKIEAGLDRIRSIRKEL